MTPQYTHGEACHVVCDNSNRFWELVPGCVYSCCPRGIKRCVAMSGLVLDGSAAQQLRSIPFEHQWEPDIETLYQVQVRFFLPNLCLSISPLFQALYVPLRT
jgi:hypothetical protein